MGSADIWQMREAIYEISASRMGLTIYHFQYKKENHI